MEYAKNSEKIRKFQKISEKFRKNQKKSAKFRKNRENSGNKTEKEGKFSWQDVYLRQDVY